MAPPRKSALIRTLEGPAPAADPVAFMEQVIVACRPGLDKTLLRKLEAAVKDWKAFGGTFDEWLGWTVGRGKDRAKATRRQIRAAQHRAMHALTAPLVGKGPNKQADAILPIARGEAPAPNEEARQALEALAAAGGRLPQSKTRLYVLSCELISGK